MAQIFDFPLPLAFFPHRVFTQRGWTGTSTIKRRENRGKLTPRREIDKKMRYAMCEVLAVEGASPAGLLP